MISTQVILSPPGFARAARVATLALHRRLAWRWLRCTRVLAFAMPTYSGSCHCGRVQFRVSGELESGTLCNCSMCTKKGFVHWVVEPGQFELLAGADALSSYRFNTGVAEHKFCRVCGIHPFYTPRSDPDKVDVNVRCLSGVDLAQLPVQGFDGQNWEQAIHSAHWRGA